MRMDPSQCHPPWPSNQAKAVKGSGRLAPTCRIIAHRCRGVVATMSWGRGNQLLLWGRTIRTRHLRARHPVNKHWINSRSWVGLYFIISMPAYTYRVASAIVLVSHGDIIIVILQTLALRHFINPSWVSTSWFVEWLWTNLTFQN